MDAQQQQLVHQLIQHNQLQQAKTLCDRLCQAQKNDSDAWFSLGLINAQMGLLDLAKNNFHQVLQLDKRDQDSWFNLGLIAELQDQLDEAVRCYQQAIAIQPDHSEAYFSLGNAYHKQQHAAEAIHHYQQAIKLQPHHFKAHTKLGLAFLSLNKAGAAIDHLKTALAICPNSVEIHCYLGNALLHKADINLAIEHFRQALHLNPKNADIHHTLGDIFKKQGNLDAAIEHYQQALRLRPENATACTNLGGIARQQGDSSTACRYFQQALQLQPNASNCFNVAVALQTLARYPEARDQYRQALRFNPDYAAAWNNLGIVLKAMGLINESIHCCQQTIRCNPRFPYAFNNLARTLEDTGDNAGALANYRQAVQFQPDSAEARSNLLFLLSYNVLCNPQELLAAHQAWDHAHGGGPDRAQTFHHDRHDDPERRLRIGYVSPDFKQHAVSFFFEPLLSAHDRRQVEVFCYAEVDKPDAVTQRLRSQTDHWCSTVGITDEALAQRIFADRIDILIDLTGHTAGNRLQAFSYKPAPIQVSYLGYCTTTGLATMDYWITDTTLYPEDSPELATESPWRLNRCWLCYRPDPEAPPVVMPQNDHITFGSLNELSKLSPAVIAVWSEILRTLPRSQLLLKTRVLADPTMQHQVRARFAEQGIAQERLQLLPRSADYLSVYQSIDIALDPFPRTGGATTADALWMGVPVITLAGEHCIERQGMSMLSAVSLEELITTSRGDYVACAAALAQDHERRNTLRSELRQRMADSPLCDAAGLTRTLENAYRQMWRQFLRQPAATL